MLVYMLLNTIEERAYIGQTTKTLARRWSEHWDEARRGSTTPLHEAMRRWDNEDLWIAVVLQPCYTLQELNATEKWWIDELSTRRPGVGYNVQPGSNKIDDARDSDRSSPLTTKITKASSPLYGMTVEERREYFRECGKRGARLRWLATTRCIEQLFD